MGLERSPSLRTVASQLTDRLWGGLCLQHAGSGMPSDAQRLAVPRRLPPPLPGSALLQRRGAGQRCSPTSRARRLYNEWQTAAQVGVKMKSLLNAFTRKEGKDRLRGAGAREPAAAHRLAGGGGPRASEIASGSFLASEGIVTGGGDGAPLCLVWNLSPREGAGLFYCCPQVSSPFRIAFWNVHPW